VRHVWIMWRWGVGNLGGVRMKYQEFQFWPMTGAVWFPSSQAALDFEERLVVRAAPLVLVIEGYNLDDTYSHDVWVGFNMLVDEPMAGRRGFIRRLTGV